MTILQRPRFGLVLPNRGVVTGTITVEEMLTLARQAEDGGWDSVWVGDSLLAKPRLDALVLLGALATHTKRVRLGPASFTSTPLRNALQLAFQWCSLDVMAQGRMIFNASQGTSGHSGGAFTNEYETFRVEPSSRMRRMEEAIEILRLTSAREHVSYEGEYNRFSEVTVLPRPLQQPLPIWISTGTDPRKPKMTARALRRVANYADGWMAIRRTPELFASNLADIRRYAHEGGRVLRDDFEACLFLDININDDREQAFKECKQFLEKYYGLEFSREIIEMQVAFGSPQACIERIREFMRVGATTFTLRIIGPGTQRQFERISREVLPAFA
ncbi:LLM class flavin-dependent oxidoreductase [Ktedonosporobacter rubrisoli]|uniref:LLM class flavin-dependent oxidoreductase n=1 Tax=Ktedonosporobacter rubrisoli TaxID=2509675 RepID=A0A4P6JXM7_KTERU|nr:LLM class flavin-dependent oxidoreductase [Ktedonosporobacter rubrisoli]QBD80295.1 LLM class flavin-dependent oxidoreductase [Ktedonosporobacter rubrisoli]